MDIKAEIEKLNNEKKTNEYVIIRAKERINEINKQQRKLTTILKHAEAALNPELSKEFFQEQEPAEHPEA